MEQIIDFLKVPADILTVSTFYVLVVVVVCYYFVDRPVAYYVHDHRIPRFEELRWLTEPPPLVQSWAPLLLVLLIVRRAVGVA